MTTDSKLTRKYYFFIKENGGYRVEIPSTLKEYVSIESKVPLGTVCVQVLSTGNFLGIYTKVSNYSWGSKSLPLPPEIKAYLAILNISFIEYS